MRKWRLVVQDEKQGLTSQIFSAVVDLAASSQFRQLRAAVAYAGVAGCVDLTRALKSNMAAWRKIPKQWLISIDFGRTDPEALDYLERLPASTVRVPDGQELLRRNLMPRRCFHAKTLIFGQYSTKVNRGPIGLFVGSANLTLSALHTGVEHATSLLWADPLTTSERQELDGLRSLFEWWKAAWNAADQVDGKFLKVYSDLKRKFPEEDRAETIVQYTPRHPHDVEASDGIRWTGARCFWIQTFELYKNLGPLKPGNQLDLRRGTRVYFGLPPRTVSPNTVLGSVSLRYNEMPARECSIRFGDNKMDKINLPLPGVDGPPTYDFTHVHFERTGRGEFLIALPRYHEERSWRRRSRDQGLLYKTTRGREFGFYS